MPTMSDDTNEQRKLSHKMGNLADRPNTKNSVTLLRYNVDNPEKSFAYGQKFLGKKEVENFQPIVYVEYELDDFYVYSLWWILHTIY